MYLCRISFQCFKLIVFSLCTLLLGAITYHRMNALVVVEATMAHKTKPWMNIAKEFDNTATPPPDVGDTVDIMKEIESTPTLGEVHMKRMDHLRYVCESGETREPMGGELQEEQVYMPPNYLSYCPAQEQSRPAISHLLQGIQKGWRNQPKESGDKGIDTDNLRNNSLRVLYAWDPYWQLFTFYVNNILVPKQEYSSIRKHIAKNKGIVVESEVCFVNVTYSDFILYTLRTSFKRIVGGVWNRCDVCGGNYDVIATPETFVQDIIYIQNLLKVKKVSQKEELELSFILKDINEHIVSAFKEKETSECFSSHALLLRLWRQLQIWGYISLKDTYPFSREESDFVTMTEFKKKVLGLSRHVLLSNTVDAFTLAYSDVPLKRLEQLRRYYYEEFIVFGYNDRPIRLFFKQSPLSDFPYFDVINVV